MNKKRALELLKQYLTEIPDLRKLHYDNQVFELWASKIGNVIKAALEPEDRRTFASAHPYSFPTKGMSPESSFVEHYQEDITMKETAIKKIIQKYEILGLDKEMPIKTGETSITRVGQTATATSPIQLFDAMQFHPKVIEASRHCFATGNYRGAILDAFISFIDYIKELASLDIDGDALVNQVFSINYDKETKTITKYPIIRINKLKNQRDRDEQQGFYFLCKGAVGGIRNPIAHKLTSHSNPLYTLEYLSFASLLFRRVEKGKVVKPTIKRGVWDWDNFRADAKNKCDTDTFRLTKKLYEFTLHNSDFVSWGTGTQDGSFTFRKLGNNGRVSIFSMYSCGWIYINFGSMKNKKLAYETINSFWVDLNNILGINIPKELMTQGKYVRLHEKALINPDNLELFKNAILSLCNQI